LRGPIYGSRNYHLHGRIWYNDPDPLYVRASLPGSEARLISSWLTVSGQLSVSSDAFADLPADRLDLLKRTMPSHGLLPRPVDLFDEPIPRVWVLKDDRRTPHRVVVGLFNWADREATLEQPLARLGLSEREEYVAFDYWSNAVVASLRDKLRHSLPPRSCAVWAVRRVADHPQLLSTSRHITQGIVDVLEEKWAADESTLTGVSRVVAGDPYEMRIGTKTTRGGWKVAKVELADTGVTNSVKERTGLLHITLHPTKSGEVRWKVRFTRAK
jgi:hypothetical protein